MPEARPPRSKERCRGKQHSWTQQWWSDKQPWLQRKRVEEF